MTDRPEVEILARALAPLAWAALGTGDTLAQKNRRKASLRHAQAALAALDAAGLVLAPREPTEAMLKAAGTGSAEHHRARWAAMLQAYVGQPGEGWAEPEHMGKAG